VQRNLVLGDRHTLNLSTQTEAIIRCFYLNLFCLWDKIKFWGECSQSFLTGLSVINHHCLFHCTTAKRCVCTTPKLCWRQLLTCRRTEWQTRQSYQHVQMRHTSPSASDSSQSLLSSSEEQSTWLYRTFCCDWIKRETCVSWAMNSR